MTRLQKHKTRSRMKQQKKAYEFWDKLPKANGNHQYLINKHVGIGQNGKIHSNQLVIPLVNISGELSTLQFIDNNGNKKFFRGGRKTGCFYSPCDLNQAETIYICEGIATCLSLFSSLGGCVVAAFDAGNLKAVACALREKYLSCEIVICADNDSENKVNTGVEKAREAAQAIGNARILYPQLVDEYCEYIEQSIDFNDAYCEFGKDVLQSRIRNAEEKEVEVVEMQRKRGKEVVRIREPLCQLTNRLFEQSDSETEPTRQLEEICHGRSSQPQQNRWG